MSASTFAPLFLLCGLVLSAPCPGQDQRYDPGKHLEGFTACEESEYFDLFDLARFRREEGETVSAARLDELRVLWRAERERGLARQAKIEQDPRQLAVLKVERKLRRDPFFRELAWTLEDAHLPYAFLLQRIGDDDRAARIAAQRVLPIVKAASEGVQRDVLEPSGVMVGDGARLFVVLALASPGTYLDCMRQHEGAGFYTGPSCWLPQFDVLVVHRDPAWSEAETANALHGAAGQAAIALLHRACTAQGGFRAGWLLAGLSAYADCTTATTGGAQYDPAWVADLVTVLLDAERRPFAVPLAELAQFAADDLGAIVRAAEMRGARAPRREEVPTFALRTFHAQCALWCSYLVAHGGEGFGRCMQRAVQGGDGTVALHAGFPEPELPALEKAFHAWLREQHLRVRPGTTLPDALPLPGAVDRASAAEPAASAAAAAPGPQPAANPLAPTAAEWQLALAGALTEARQGAFSRALAAVAAIDATAAGEEAQGRLARAQERWRALVDVRQRLLALHADGKKLFDMEVGGKRVRGKVEKVTDRHASVRAGKDLVEVDLDGIEPAKLDIAARRFTVLAKDAWQCAYLQFLADGAPDKLRRKLTGSDAASESLRQDLASYTELAALSEPARLLALLAGGADGKDALAALEQLVEKHGTLPAVAARQAALRERAQVLLAATFDPFSAVGLGVRADVERAGERTVRLRYSGKKPAQLADFVPDANYLEEWRTEEDDKGPPAIRQVGGAFEPGGNGVIRLPVQLAAPFKVEWRGSLPADGLCYLGLCDDGKGSFLRVGLGGSILLVNRDLGSMPLAEPMEMFADTEYTVTVEHDGKEVRTAVDGAAAARSAKFGGLTHGGMMLFLRGGASRIQELTIETAVDGPAAEAMRARWVARRLGEIFPAGR